MEERLCDDNFRWENQRQQRPDGNCQLEMRRTRFQPFFEQLLTFHLLPNPYRITDATRAVAVTSASCVAPTAQELHQRTRPSNVSQSATWSNQPPFVISLMPAFTTNTHCPNCTSNWYTAFHVQFTLTSFVLDLLKVAVTVLHQYVFVTTKMVRRSTLPSLLCKTLVLDHKPEEHLLLLSVSKME